MERPLSDVLVLAIQQTQLTSLPAIRLHIRQDEHPQFLRSQAHVRPLPDEILDKIQAYLRSKRSVLADRFAFLDCHQHSNYIMSRTLHPTRSLGRSPCL